MSLTFEVVCKKLERIKKGNQTNLTAVKLAAVKTVLIDFLWPKGANGQRTFNKKGYHQLSKAFHPDRFENQKHAQHQALAQWFTQISSKVTNADDLLKCDGLIAVIHDIKDYTKKELYKIDNPSAIPVFSHTKRPRNPNFNSYPNRRPNSNSRSSYPNRRPNFKRHSQTHPFPETRPRHYRPADRHRQDSLVDEIISKLKGHHIMFFTAMREHTPLLFKLFYPMTYLFAAAEQNFKTAKNRLNLPLSIVYQLLILGGGSLLIFALSVIAEPQLFYSVFNEEAIGLYLVLQNLIYAELALFVSVFSMAVLSVNGGLGEDGQQFFSLRLVKRLVVNVLTLPFAILASIHPINFIKGCFQHPRVALAELLTWCQENVYRSLYHVLSTISLGTGLAALYFLPTGFLLQVAGGIGVTGLLLNVPNILEKIWNNPASIYAFPKQYITDMAVFYQSVLQTSLAYTVKPAWQGLSAMVSYGFDASYRAAKTIFNVPVSVFQFLFRKTEKPVPESAGLRQQRDALLSQLNLNNLKVQLAAMEQQCPPGVQGLGDESIICKNLRAQLHLLKTMHEQGHTAPESVADSGFYQQNQRCFRGPSI